MLKKEHDQQPGRTQLQESDSANLVLPSIKKADVKALLTLLLGIDKLKNVTKETTLTITDIGCGEGLMLKELFSQLKESLQNYMLLKFNIYGCEPKLLLREKFISFFKSEGNIQQIEIEDKYMEDYHPKKSDIILCSHTFYYSQKKWNTSKFNDIAFNENLLTRFINQLNENGSLCVILQSTQNSNQLKMDRNPTANHANWEDVMYPTAVGEAHNTIATHTQAEIFENVFSTFRAEYQRQTQQVLNINDASAYAVIDLGEVNFTKVDSNGQYPQNETVGSLFNFYIRGLYPKLSGDKQKILLDFIHDNCLNDKNTFVMCHVNRVFVITKNEKVLQTVSNNNVNSTSMELTK